jgi:hypothetical protein
MIKHGGKFSDDDKENARESGQVSYLATTMGKVKKFNPRTGIVTTIGSLELRGQRPTSYGPRTDGKRNAPEKGKDWVKTGKTRTPNCKPLKDTVGVSCNY